MLAPAFRHFPARRCIAFTEVITRMAKKWATCFELAILLSAALSKQKTRRHSTFAFVNLTK